MEQDDDALLARIVDGDLKAFERLYKSYHSRLTQFLSRMLRNDGLVEEALNDTMMVVWRRADSFNGQSKPSTWIYAIAYRMALKAYRRKDEPLEDIDSDKRVSPDVGPEQTLGRLQIRRVLEDALNGLSADHRVVVDLAYFHEMGYREIADIMDCPVDTVKTRMYHARRNLKSRVPGHIGDWL